MLHQIFYAPTFLRPPFFGSGYAGLGNTSTGRVSMNKPTAILKLVAVTAISCVLYACMSTTTGISIPTEQEKADLARINQNWHQLRRGMTLKEVEKQIGGLVRGSVESNMSVDLSTKKMTSFNVKSEYYCPSYACELSFVDGSLETWSKRK